MKSRPTHLAGRAIVADGVHDAASAGGRRVDSYSTELRKLSEEWSFLRLYQTSMHSKIARRAWARVAQL